MVEGERALLETALRFLRLTSVLSIPKSKLGTLMLPYLGIKPGMRAPDGDIGDGTPYM
jgi:hypothetical protein